MFGRPPPALGRVPVLLVLVVLCCSAAVTPVQGAMVPDTTDATGTWSDDETADSRTSASDGSTIHRSLVLSLTPKQPGEIAATATFDIPSSVRSLETTLPSDATVTNTRGFSKQDSQTYTWDEATQRPSIRFTVPANETFGGIRATESTLESSRSAQSDSYSFVDTGSWALVAVPQLGSRWRYVGDRVTLQKGVSVEGEGATGGEIAYLGPHRTVERTAHGQRFEFVIPAAATLAEQPSEILDSTVAASDTLRVGDRDEHVFMVAAPTTVKWSAAGIEYGGNDYWVKDDERLSDPRNVWLHEYVHTRQSYKPATETRWTTEAGAEYYAALLTLQQERIRYDTFRSHLDRGTREPAASAILADPTTWSTTTPYLKGSLVFGNIDRQIRVDSNRTNSMQAVLSRMNADPDEVTASEFHSFVAAAGNSNTRTYAERYAGTKAVPDSWTASEHQTAFGSLPARIGYRTLDVSVTGDGRNETLTDDTVVSTGETVTATVEVANTGGAGSTFETVMYVDDTVVATASGSIAAEETKTVTLSHTFEEPGTYSLSVAGTTRTVVVEEPATPEVSELLVNASSNEGSWTATITVTLTNPSSRTATGTIPVTLDGATVASLEATLAPNESTTRTITTPIEPGSHTIAAGNASTTIDIPAPTTTTTTSTPAFTPGFSISTAGIALLLALLLLRRHE